MMVTSLLLATILLSIYQRRTGKKAGLLLMGCFFTVVIALNIISNLTRIVCLIQFEIPPASVFHELTGILCLVLYVIAPAMFSCNWMIKKWGKPVREKNDVVIEMPTVKRIGLHFLLIIAIMTSAFRVNNRDINMANNTASVPAVSGYTCQRVKADVVKLENKSSLIYLKAIPDYFNPDHNPMICWTGSGYILERIQEEKLESREIYTALLKKEKEELYTAWWYSNGTTHTISQARLRWELLSVENNLHSSM
jgi:exosortase N